MSPNSFLFGACFASLGWKHAVNRTPSLRLEALGDEKRRAHNRENGAAANQCGVR